MRLAVSLLHEEDEARDTVQEVFLKLWEGNVRIDHPEAFIVRAVRNACLNRISMLDTRGRIRRRIMLETPADDDGTDRRNEAIRSAVNRQLSPREREVVERIYTEGMSYKEAAESLGVSVAAINKNVVSALKKLRNHFKTGKS